MKWLILLLLLIPSGVTHAQSCNPASVYYIVRDEKGVVLSKEDLQTMVDQLPKKIGDATVWATEVSFAPDKQAFYWPESVEFDKGNKVPALGLSNAATCTLHLTAGGGGAQGLGHIVGQLEHFQGAGALFHAAQEAALFQGGDQAVDAGLGFEVQRLLHFVERRRDAGLAQAIVDKAKQFVLFARQHVGQSVARLRAKNKS